MVAFLAKLIHLFPLFTMPRQIIVSPDPSVVLVATHPNRPVTEWVDRYHRAIYINPEDAVVDPVDGLDVQDIVPSYEKKKTLEATTEDIDLIQRYSEWSEWRLSLPLRSTARLYSLSEYQSMEHNIARRIDRIAKDSTRRHLHTTVLLSYLWLHPDSVWSSLQEQNKVLVLSPFLDEYHKPYGDLLYIPESQLLQNQI